MIDIVFAYVLGGHILATTSLKEACLESKADSVTAIQNQCGSQGCSGPAVSIISCLDSNAEAAAFEGLEEKPRPAEEKSSCQSSEECSGSKPETEL